MSIFVELTVSGKQVLVNTNLVQYVFLVKPEKSCCSSQKMRSS